jgi:PAS domain S-box-containing protein
MKENISILLVEDEAIEAMDIKNTLESFGYKVPYVASEGNEAVLKALELKPDLILMDLFLRDDMDGMQVANQIKDLQIPIIFLTAHSEEVTVKKALKTKPFGYLLKPFERVELKFTVELVLNKSKLEKKLRKSEADYRFLTEKMNDIIWTQDLNLKTTYVSQSIKKVLGFTPEERLKQDVQEQLTPKSLIMAQSELTKELTLEAQGLTDPDRTLQIELEYYHKDGSTRWLENVISSIRDGNGQIIGLHGVSRDITQRKESEKIIKQQYNIFEGIINSTDSPIFSIDTSYCYTSFNSIHSKLMKDLYDADIEIGKNILKYMTAEDSVKAKKNIDKTLKGESLIVQEFSGDENRSRLCFEILHNPIKDNNDKIIGAALFARDITKHRQAEKALKISEKNYRTIFEHTGTAIIILDENGIISQVNSEFEKLSGYSKDEIVGKKKWTIFIIEDECDRLKEYSMLRLEDPKAAPPVYETKGKNRQNHIVNILVTVSSIPDTKQKLVSIIDISERKKVEDELKLSEEKFRSLIYNSTDLIRILDKDGLIIFDSPSSERILGFPEGYLLGKSPLEFIHPGDQQKVKEDLEDVYANINPGTPTEFRILKADGTYVSVETIAQNMTDVPGIEGIVLTTHPIQQRKEMEDALRESEEKYRTLFEEDPDYTMLIGKDGKILEVNKAITSLGGLSKNDLVGKDFSKLEIISSEDMRLYYGKITNLLKGKDIKPFESRFKDKNGNIHWIIIHLIPVKKNGNIIYILGIGSDITEQKIAENKIKSSLKEKSILLQEIHHRVKNNMQIISSLLNLQTQYVDEEEAFDVLMESQNRVRSMALIHEKLYQSSDLTHINFVDYVNSLVSNLFYSYNIKKGRINPILKIENVSLNIETSVPCGLIISEIVSNSLKYAFPNDKSGVVCVSLRSVGDKYELIISDNGIGLPEELDFNHLDSLGLRLVNSLTEQIDGELTVKRVHGTEFNITFKESEYKNRL